MTRDQPDARPRQVEIGGPVKHQLPKPQQSKRAQKADAYAEFARQVYIPGGPQHFPTVALGIRIICLAAAGSRNDANDPKKLMLAQGGLRSAGGAATFSDRGPGN